MYSFPCFRPRTSDCIRNPGDFRGTLSTSLRGRVSGMHSSSVVCARSCGVAVHRENGVGWPTFLATGSCWPKLKIPGRIAIGGKGKEEETSHFVIPSSPLIFLDFVADIVANFHRRGVRDKRNVTNVG